MSGDTTTQALKRLTYLENRDPLDNGTLIAGQEYYDVYFTGGYAANLVLEDVEITNPVFTSPLSLENGGTGASLSDPGADRIAFWDESAGTVDWLIPGSGLVITDKTMTVSGVGLGDVTGPGSSIDNAVARFDGATGKIIQNSGALIDDSGNISANNLSGTNTGDQTITLTGDVTGTGTGSFATQIAANVVGDAELRQGTAISVIGRSANSTGNVADIQAISDGNVLRRSGSTLAFGGIDLSNTPHAVTGALGIANGGTNATDAATAFSNIKQAATTSATGVVELLTSAELRTGTDTTRAPTADVILAALGFSSYYASPQQTITNGNLITLAHSLPRAPVFVRVTLVCTTAELGWSIGDQVEVEAYSSTNAGLSSSGLTAGSNATNVYCQIGSSGVAINQRSATAGTASLITNASWRIVIRAWA